MTSDRLAEEKQALRATMRARRAAVSADEARRAGVDLARRLAAMAPLATARTVLATLPAGSEIDTRPFCQAWLDRGGRLALPRVEPDGTTLSAWLVPGLEAIAPGFRGCPEPDVDKCKSLSAKELDAVLVPGLAFDRQGNRLGQGGGHFDRFLAGLPADRPVIGLAYDFQVVERVPAKPPRDCRVQWVATPAEVILCGVEE
ncbi:MAG: 5-formyltetrahydrofolate cyclo-ligase [Candidatus Sumerlaeia bacterium]|nr:5-formyltetrahydrofolate cyclo-ligase [Candidatus Sumerlaeia bacterium]